MSLWNRVKVFCFVLLLGCGPKGNDQSQITEAWDLYSHPSIMGIPIGTYDQLRSSAATRGEMEQAPWRDDYWPFYRKGIAYRYHTGQSFADKLSQLKSIRSQSDSLFASPAEKYDTLVNDELFSVTSESWDRYNRYQAMYPNDPSQWKWMGICSGWAPASIVERAPGGNVLAVTEEGREVLFFEGDLRALLSKAYDINAMSENQRVIGSRCNYRQGDVKFDQHGRPVDGHLIAEDRSFYITRDHSASFGAIEVSFDPNGSERFWLVSSRGALGRLEGQRELFRYQTQEAVVADLREQTVGHRAVQPRTTTVRLYKSCRDVNPGAFHLALVHFLSESAEKKESFILEISRFLEVWNHPVWAFQSELGRPKPISMDSPEKKFFRAPGTAFTLDVATTIVYAGAISPQAEYSDHVNIVVDWENHSRNQSLYSTRSYYYTLEFNSNGYLLGGEWRESPTGNIQPTDFIWKPYGTLTDIDKNSEKPSMLKYSLLRQLLDCSRKEADQEISGHIRGQDRRYNAVRCPVKLNSSLADEAEVIPFL